MSDGNLIGMGIAVVFTAFGGAYVYMRQCYEAAQRLQEARIQRERPKPRRLRKVA